MSSQELSSLPFDTVKHFSNGLDGEIKSSLRHCSQCIQESSLDIGGKDFCSVGSRQIGGSS